MDNKKRKPSVLLLAGICIIIVVIIIGIALIVRQLSWESGGKGTKSPYKWKEEGNKVTLSFDTSKLGKGVWNIKGNENGFLKIKQEENQNREVFYVTGNHKGTMILEFIFSKKEEDKTATEEELYRMMAEFEVSGDKMTIKRTMAKDIAEAQTEGKDTQNPFTYKVDEAGNLNLKVSNVEEVDWEYNEDEIPFYVTGPSTENSVLEMTIRNGGMPEESNESEENRATPIPAAKAGTKATLKLTNKRLGASITLELEVDKAGQIVVKSTKAKGPSKEELARIREQGKPAEILSDQ